MEEYTGNDNNENEQWTRSVGPRYESCSASTLQKGACMQQINHLNSQFVINIGVRVGQYPLVMRRAMYSIHCIHICIVYIVYLHDVEDDVHCTDLGVKRIPGHVVLAQELCVMCL